MSIKNKNMYCKECGQIIDDDSKFCRFCGKSQIILVDKPDSTQTSKEINVNISLFGKNKGQTDNEKVTKEKIKRFDDTYKKENDATVIGLIIVIVNVILLILGVYSDWIASNNGFYLIFSIVNLIWRIVATVWVSNIAKRQNRDSFTWGFFAFFIPNLALVIVGLLRKRYVEIDKYNQVKDYENRQNIQLEKTINTIDKETNIENDLKVKMEKYNIKFENDKYIYMTYKYDKVQDAINYAELMEQKNK